MAEHSTLTDPELHEPKGAASATANTVYVANGSGSGTWTNVAYANVTGTPSLATVATSGAYSDLSGTPSLATVATTGAYSDLSGTPSLATVATSGDYTDLTNKPKGYYSITHHIEDISTAGDHYVPIPKAGTVTNVTSVIEDAIATADLVLTVYNSAAASMGTLTVTQTGSAAGDVDSLAPASNNTVTANDYVRIAGDGGPTAHVSTSVTVLVEFDL